MSKLMFCIFFILSSFSSKSFSNEWQPDFLIVGAQKSGTSALVHFLSQHPLIMKNSGEIHFFDHNFLKGVSWYKKRFDKRPTSDHLIVDKSPYYLFHPSVPERVYSLYPHIKIIMILRNPVDRAYSHYWRNIRRKYEDLSFEEAIKAESMRLSQGGVNVPRFSYLARGRYAEQIENWLNYFPRDQMLILSSTDLRNNPHEVINDCFTFVGLPPCTVNIDNPDSHTYYEPMDPETRKELSAYFKSYNEDLERLLNRQFHWD